LSENLELVAYATEEQKKKESVSWDEKFAPLIAQDMKDITDPKQMEADAKFKDYWMTKFNSIDVQINTAEKEIKDAEELNKAKQDPEAFQAIEEAKQDLQLMKDRAEQVKKTSTDYAYYMREWFAKNDNYDYTNQDMWLRAE